MRLTVWPEMTRLGSFSGLAWRTEPHHNAMPTRQPTTRANRVRFIGLIFPQGTGLSRRVAGSGRRARRSVSPKGDDCHLENGRHSAPTAVQVEGRRGLGFGPRTTVLWFLARRLFGVSRGSGLYRTAAQSQTKASDTWPHGEPTPHGDFACRQTALGLVVTGH